jgi:DNA-binding LacI/PurR family transcriptional regulator
LLRSARSRLLGVVFGIEHDFHAQLVGRLYPAAEQRGYELALSATGLGRGEETAVSSLLDDRCEALILLGPHASTARLVELAGRLPVVAVARQVRAERVDVVRTADDLGAAQAVNHLVALGHRRIAHVDGGRAPGAAERRRGYRRALAVHGLAAAEQIVTGGLGEVDGSRAAHQLLARRTLPTAVTVFNDRCAIGVLDVFRGRRVRIPEDVSVVGYDDSPLAGLSTFGLTTIAQDTAQLAGLAAARAVDRLTGTAVGPRQQLVAPKLVLRSTTAPLP